MIYTKKKTLALLILMKMIRRFYLMMISWAAMLPMMGQEENDGSLLNGLDYKVEVQSSVSEGNTPLWLNANKHGLSSLRFQ